MEDFNGTARDTVMRMTCEEMVGIPEDDSPPEVFAGLYRVFWDSSDKSGRPVASGIYFCRLSTGREATSRPIVLLR